MRARAAGWMALQDARGPIRDAERVIAHIARAVWDTWGSAPARARQPAAPAR